MKRCQEPGTDFKNMKKLFFSIAALALAASSNAQQVTAPEPEIIGSYCMLTSDSTYVVLPKENGKVEKHQNKFSKFSKIAGAVSDLGFAGGMVGLSTGSMAGLETGVRVMGTAAGVGLAADAVNTLAGVEGMDIAFAGGKSAHSIKKDGKDIRLLIKVEKNDYDPMGIYRIVRFKASKKDRRIQWLTLQPAVLGSSDAQKKGYLSFSGHKYGNQSYLLTIPASELEPGEYGIIYMAVASAQEIPFGTFSITK